MVDEKCFLKGSIYPTLKLPFLKQGRLKSSMRNLTVDRGVFHEAVCEFSYLTESKIEKGITQMFTAILWPIITAYEVIM